MDFKQTLLLIINELNTCRIDYSLIGGFAMGLYGIDRATSDLDFLINEKDINEVKKLLLQNGYELLFSTDNVLQFVSPLADFGEIDILIAKREVSLGMLKNKIEKNIFENTVKIKIVKPEDIIGLKLQAIRNDKSRENIDRSDIKYLIKNHPLDIDTITRYAALLDMTDYLKQIISEVSL